MLLLPLKKVTAPAHWAAAEPETAGKGLCPLPVLCDSQAADFNNGTSKTSVFRDTHNIKAKIRKFKKSAISP